MTTTKHNVLALLEKTTTVLLLVAVTMYLPPLNTLWEGLLSVNPTYMVPVLLVLMCGGVALQQGPKQIHRRKIPFIVYTALMVLLLFFVFFTKWWIGAVVVLLGLLAVSTWNLVLETKFSKKKIRTIRV